MYAPLGVFFHSGDKFVRFRSGATLSFSHLQHEDTKYDWQGSQIPLIMFDELTHFTATQFWYLLSRNRSMCGVRPYVRASCNPDADSWVADLIAWWIDQDSGLAIPDRAGVIRWFARVADEMHWADSAAELKERFPQSEPKSLTFVPAKLADNQALMIADPGYLSNLMAQQRVERARLLDGNWRVRPSAGMYFHRSWLKEMPAEPVSRNVWRAWDMAATPKTDLNDPDWTCGTKMLRTDDGKIVVLDHIYFRGTPQKVRDLIRNTAVADGRMVKISIPQDPGQAGVAQVDDYSKALQGYPVFFSPESRATLALAQSDNAQAAKISRFSPFSAQAEAGNVYFMEGTWNERWFSQLEAFPEGRHDDDVDSTSRAFNAMMAGPGPMRISAEAVKISAGRW
jgi:predicted phage terminase large subunit-like protein